MDRDRQAYLFDVVENADRILGFVDGLDRDGYRSSDLVRSAVERRFINNGEALTKLKQLDLRAFASIPDGAKIVAFRNVLVHGYESISDELVWEIITDHLRDLRDACATLLES